jgi:pimeloyl-ACP methyl ester carboxylesterase
MRGTGASVPIRCDPNAWNAFTWPIVEDEASYKDMVSRAEAFGQSCVNMTGPLIYHLGTNQAVRDLDLLRQVLGHDKLNYLGLSYGSQFGSEYAEAFPDNVGRMVLDGVSNRHLTDEVFMTTSTLGTESTFNDFFRWRNTTADCALYGRDQAAIFDAVVSATEDSRLRAQVCFGGREYSSKSLPVDRCPPCHFELSRYRS